MTTCATVLAETLEAYGVRWVFGIPGNHTLELYRGLSTTSMHHVTARHEQGAAFMADGFARASGEPGVCYLISGPGLTNAATAIAQARGDSVPMLVITAVAPTSELGMREGRLHELPNQAALARELFVWSHTLLDAGNLEKMLARAFTTFRCMRPGPVHIEIPLDIMVRPAETHAPWAIPDPPSADPRAIAGAADMIGDSKKPLILVGGGAVNAGHAIAEIARRMDAPVLNTTNAKGVLALEHPLRVGGSPSLPALRQALETSDLVLAVGTEFGETDFDLLMSGALDLQGDLIRLDIDPLQLVKNVAPALGIVSDAERGLAALALACSAQQRGGAQRAADLKRALRHDKHYHIDYHAVLTTIASHADVLLGDSTQPTYYAAWQYEPAHPRSYFHSVSGFGTLGYAIPAAIGAKLARPQDSVVALIGDGAAQFTLPELGIAADLELSVAFIVWNNNGYEEIKNSMRARGIDAKTARVKPPDFKAIADAYGCAHRAVQTVEQLAGALDEQKTYSTPTLVEVRQADFISQPSGQWYA
ncbi:MAG: 5-guanidino-2-oxopentanoate decarboxylase [Gammaproteobacteria bacterium]|nr:5-guanidino-2-oxopentanoate decarboxylase [Gammaproteobacteria bacterium]